jgi:hypothetical protein
MVLIFDLALTEYLPKEKIPRDPTEFQQQWDRHLSPIWVRKKEMACEKAIGLSLLNHREL